MTKVTSASQLGLSKDFPKAATKARKPTVSKTARPGKPNGSLLIEGDVEKVKRPLMVSDMKYKQIFVREGRLCMRVMNVCNANIKGKASKPTDLWIVDLNEGKTFLSSDIPVELVDATLTITNKKAA